MTQSTLSLWNLANFFVHLPYHFQQAFIICRLGCLKSVTSQLKELSQGKAHMEVGMPSDAAYYIRSVAIKQILFIQLLPQNYHQNWNCKRLICYFHQSLSLVHIGQMSDSIGRFNRNQASFSRVQWTRSNRSQKGKSKNAALDNKPVLQVYVICMITIM